MSVSQNDLSPINQNYLTSNLVYKNITQNFKTVTLGAQVSASVTPKVLLNGQGNACLQGSLTITTASGLAEILDLPSDIIPLNTAYYPVIVLRSSSLIANAVKLSADGSAIDSIVVDTVGDYLTLPLAVLTGPGSGATLVTHMQAVNAPIAAAGSGYAPTDTITLSGGTFTTASIVTVLTTKLASAAVNAMGAGYIPSDTIVLSGGTSSTKPTLTVTNTQLASFSLGDAGSGYAASDTITLAGGTAATKAILAVATTKLVSVALNAAGSGYAESDTITLTGGTFTTAAILTVETVDGGGAILTFSINNPGSYTVNSATFTQGSTSGMGTGATFQTGLFGFRTGTISNAGSYTANAASFTQFSTSGAGTDATFTSPSFGVKLFSITAAGVFTVNSTSFTQFSTSGAGTGVTFNTGLFGVNTVGITTAGDYTVLPSNPVSQAATSGAGTGATFTMHWGVLSVTVSAGGSGFNNNSAINFIGGSGNPQATAHLVLGDSTTGQLTLVTAPSDGDVVYLDSVNFFTQSYS